MKIIPKGPLRYPKLPIQRTGVNQVQDTVSQGITLSFFDVRTFTCPQPATNQKLGGIMGPITGAFCLQSTRATLTQQA